jgi:pilus assembly protein Flp/PilA
MLVNSARTSIALKLHSLKADRRAVTAIEYALIAALIAVVIIGAVSALGTDAKNTFSSVASELSGSTSTSSSSSSNHNN